MCRMALIWLGDTILTLRLHPAASLTDHTCRVVFLYVGASRLFSGSVDNSINVSSDFEIICSVDLLYHLLNKFSMDRCCLFCLMFIWRVILKCVGH